MSSRICVSTFLLLLSSLSLAAGAAAQNRPPVADAGPDQTLECSAQTGADVTLDGSASSDLDGDVLTYTWTGAALPLGLPLDGVMPTVPLPPGVHELTLTIDDAMGGMSSDTVLITIDTTLPVLVLKQDSDELWPPNHKLHVYRAADLVESVSDECGTPLAPEDVIFARGTSDEAEDGVGDGSTTGDIAFGAECKQAALRAERAGPRDGRVYELFLAIADDAGNETVQTFRVDVPHDAAHAAVDSGDAYEVTECGGLVSCPDAPAACSEAGVSELAIRSGKKGARLRWRATDFMAGGLSDGGSALCLYVDDAPAGESLAPDKVKHKTKQGVASLGVRTRGDDLEIPALPIASGAELRVELHGASGVCVGSTFAVDAASLNEADAFEAENE